jgi:hypothetical protein
MAHLWTADESGAWTPSTLAGDARTLSLSVALRRIGETAGADWALLSTPAARVFINGLPASLGTVLLADRDEIRVADNPVLFFSTETLATVEPFHSSGPRGFCPRCKQSIESGTPAVRCPSCGLWHHASADFPCWTYAPQCAACAHDTALGTGFRWTPEEL